jgi:hypothetical protein
VATSPVHRDPQAVGGGQHGPRVRADQARREGQHVLRQRHRRGGDEVGESVVEHSPRSVTGLLRRLEQRHQGPVPAVPAVGEQLGRTQQAGDVQVVAAGVHHGHLVAVGIGGDDRAGVRKTGGLANRQGVHVGAQQHRRAVPVVQDADHAGAADALVHLEAGRPQSVGREPSGASLLARQLGIAVEVAVELLLPGADPVQPRHQGGRPGGDGRRRHGRPW